MASIALLLTLTLALPATVFAQTSPMEKVIPDDVRQIFQTYARTRGESIGDKLGHIKEARDGYRYGDPYIEYTSCSVSYVTNLMKSLIAAYDMQDPMQVSLHAGRAVGIISGCVSVGYFNEHYSAEVSEYGALLIRKMPIEHFASFMARALHSEVEGKKAMGLVITNKMQLPHARKLAEFADGAGVPSKDLIQKIDRLK